MYCHFSEFLQPEPAQFAEKNKEILYENVSRNHSILCFSCLGTSRSSRVRFDFFLNRPKILSKLNRIPVAYIGSSVVKALGLNSNLLLESMVRYPTKIERVIFLTRHIIAGPPPVGGGNFVSLIRIKLVLKNKEFSCVDRVIYTFDLWESCLPKITSISFNFYQVSDTLPKMHTA